MVHGVAHKNHRNIDWRQVKDHTDWTGVCQGWVNVNQCAGPFDYVLWDKWLGSESLGWERWTCYQSGCRPWSNFVRFVQTNFEDDGGFRNLTVPCARDVYAQLVTG